MTKDEALDERELFRIPEKITVHVPEKLKDTIIDHYKKMGSG